MEQNEDLTQVLEWIEATGVKADTPLYDPAKLNAYQLDSINDLLNRTRNRTRRCSIKWLLVERFGFPADAPKGKYMEILNWIYSTKTMCSGCAATDRPIHTNVGACDECLTPSQAA